MLVPLLGMALCVAHSRRFERMGLSGLLWAPAACAAALALSVAVGRFASRRAGRVLAAALLTIMHPGLGQMSLGRIGAGSAIVALVAAVWLSGHWTAAYALGLAAAAGEFALARLRPAEPPGAELGERAGRAGGYRSAAAGLACIAALFLGVMSALGLFVQLGGRARTSPEGEVIAVLGGGVPRGAAWEPTLARTREAASLMETGLYRKVIAVGTGQELEAMSRELGRLGVDGSRVSFTRATNTYNSMAALPPLVRLTVVTSREHVARADLFGRAQGRPPEGFKAVGGSPLTESMRATLGESLALGAYLSALPWLLLAGPP